APDRLWRPVNSKSLDARGKVQASPRSRSRRAALHREAAISTIKGGHMSRRTASAILVLTLCVGCGGVFGEFRQPTCEQRLPSGKQIKVTSCLLAWGGEHEERRPNQDAFALEYVSAISPSAGAALNQEALEVFE